MNFNSWTILSAAVILASVGVLILLERVRPYACGERFFREGFWTELLFYTILQNLILAVVIGKLIQWLDGTTHLSRLHLISGWPLWVQVGFFVVTHDLYIYWFHRWQHHNLFLWRPPRAPPPNKPNDCVGRTRSAMLPILTHPH